MGNIEEYKIPEFPPVHENMEIEFVWRSRFDLLLLHVTIQNAGHYLVPYLAECSREFWTDLQSFSPPECHWFELSVRNDRLANF